MAPLDQLEMNEIVVKILQDLSATPYSCSSLTQLTSGTTNFVFRGTLTSPVSLHGDTKEGIDAPISSTVIIKYSTGFAAVNKDFPIDASRCVVEESMLDALKNFPYTASVVRVPQLYLFNRDTNTQVLEDFPGVIDLQTFLVGRNDNQVITKSIAISIGHALGSWLRAFHSWTSSSSQSDLSVEIGNNEPMRKLKYQISYHSFIEVLERFQEVLGSYKKTLEEVREMASTEFERTASDGNEKEWGLIHGDFWTGNVLLPETQRPGEEMKLVIVDWEFAQFGHRSYDIGQMIGDFYERKHFRGVRASLWAIDAFIEGYGSVSEDMAYWIAIHTGVQLITWVNRGPPLHMRPAWATRERVIDILKLGMTFILKGWDKDRTWFESGVLAGLFRAEDTTIPTEGYQN